jgi:hypothetical protein
MATEKEKVVRAHLRFSGKQAEYIQELKDVLGLNTEADVARYLIGRGLEASSTQLASLRMLHRMEERFTPEEMLPLFKELEGGE